MKVYSPGCALLIYKPHLAESVLAYLKQNDPGIAIHEICCRHDPNLPPGSTIVNTCAGCDRRFGSLYDGIDTVSLWEVLAESDFPFPDHSGLTLSLHDPCPIRGKPQVHRAVRRLLERMQIALLEAPAHGTNSVCCGDSFYPNLEIERVHEQMRARAQSMPCAQVAVYCVSCVKSMHIGGKTPRYLLDLLFGEPTEIGEYDTEKWHAQIDAFIERH